MKPTLNDWVWIQAMASQALLGAMSENLRKVDLVLTDDAWVIEAVLAAHDDADIEEMEDSADDATIFTEEISQYNKISEAASKVFKAIVLIDSKPLAISPPENFETRRTIYRKKEYICHGEV